MKPVFNYDITVADRINQITNQPGHGTVRMMLPASTTDECIVEALVGVSNAGICKWDSNTCYENSGLDQDLYYEVLVPDFEHYMIFMRELIESWDLIPIAIVYIPSKEEVAL